MSGHVYASVATILAMGELADAAFVGISMTEQGDLSDNCSYGNAGALSSGSVSPPAVSIARTASTVW